MPSPFQRGYRSTPVPNPLLAELLVEISDPDELRITLRTIWALHRKKGFPTYVTLADLTSDRTVAAMLGADGEELEKRVASILAKALRRGTLLAIRQHPGHSRYYLNTEPVRRALYKQYPEMPGELTSGGGRAAGELELETWPNLEAAFSPSPAAVAYEENIGPITPLVAEVVDAIREAVDKDARNWSYVAAALRRPRKGQTEDGEPGGDTQAVRSDEFIRWYRERQRNRGNR